MNLETATNAPRHSNLSRPCLVARRPCANPLCGDAATTIGRLPARALGNARWRLHRPGLARRPRRGAAGGAVPWPGGRLAQCLRPASDGRVAAAWLARRRAAFSRLFRRSEPLAARLSLRRQRRNRLHPAPTAATQPHAVVRRRRIAGRQRAAEMAGRTGRRSGGSAARGGGGFRTARPAGGGRRAGSRLYPHLYRPLSDHAETQGAGQAGSLSRLVRPGSVAIAQPHRSLRHAGHRIAARLSRRRRLLAQIRQQALAGAYPGADADHQRPQRPVHAGPGAAWAG